MSHLHPTRPLAPTTSRRAYRRLVLGVGVTYGDMAPQHPLIETEARLQFRIGKREQAVVASMRAAEVRVRRLAGLGNDAIGVDLMTKAVGPSGRLTGPPAVKAEQEQAWALFAGAYAVLRHPPGHRQVDDDDGSAAAEAAQAASLLIRIPDRAEDRLGAVA